MLRVHCGRKVFAVEVIIGNKSTLSIKRGAVQNCAPVHFHSIVARFPLMTSFERRDGFDAAGIERAHRVIVPEQNDGFARCLPRERAMFRLVNRALRLQLRMLERAGALNSIQQSVNFVIEHLCA